MRGTPLGILPYLMMVRITPACAGNTICRSLAVCRWRDHPRMCGEHSDKTLIISSPMGSPPHVRGTLKFSISLPAKTRITPACAGNTSWGDGSTCGFSDHPRMCGEHAIKAVAGEIRAGSPPHVRGTLLLLPHLDKCHRITPACAGNTSGCSTTFVAPTDHPRMCGEHIYLVKSKGTYNGSPPHVRGTHCHLGSGYQDT